jgi:hypothetical protein
MAVNVHSFAGASPEPLPASAIDDDEGAPPALPPGGRITKVNSDGEIESSDTSLTPEELARRAKEPPRKAAPSSAVTSAPVAGQPLSSAIAALGNPERALRLRCLELAARSGETDSAKLMDRAREFLDFVGPAS